MSRPQMSQTWVSRKYTRGRCRDSSLAGPSCWPGLLRWWTQLRAKEGWWWWREHLERAKVFSWWTFEPTWLHHLHFLISILKNANRHLSLCTGCTCRCSQNQKEEQGKPGLWCHLLLHCCQPIGSLCGKPSPISRSVVEENQRNWREANLSFLQVNIVLSVIELACTIPGKTNILNFFWSQGLAVRISLFSAWGEHFKTSADTHWWSRSYHRR